MASPRDARTTSLSSLDRGERKEALRALLLSRGWTSGSAFSAPSAGLFRMLVGFLQSPEELLRWRAVEALGQAASRCEDLHAVREVVRSLLWGMNDESGNLFRMAPEALGSILLARGDLRDEFAGLLPQFLDEEPFEEGALWALCQLAARGWSPGSAMAEKLRSSLAHPRPRRRGLALRLCRLAGLPLGGGAAAGPTEFEDYDLGTGVLAATREPPEPPGQVC